MKMITTFKCAVILQDLNGEDYKKKNLIVSNLHLSDLETRKLDDLLLLSKLAKDNKYPANSVENITRSGLCNREIFNAQNKLEQLYQVAKKNNEN